MDGYVNRFLELIIYVKYIIYEKVNIIRLLSGLPLIYRGRIEVVEP